jgi:hypothetical protein
MAKCFQVVGQGIPVRMSDADAFQVVDRDKDGQYCPKHVWKERRDGAYSKENGLTCLAKLVGTRIMNVDTLQRNLQHRRGK